MKTEAEKETARKQYIATMNVAWGPDGPSDLTAYTAIQVRAWKQYLQDIGIPGPSEYLQATRR